MVGRSRRAKVNNRHAVLAAIARREWLLQMLALGAAGCGRRDDPARSRASTLVMAINSIDDLRPDFSDLDFLVFSPLLERNEHGDFVSRLAERWEHSDDNREWTYYLRRNVRWHDGVPVTAHDVKFSLDLVTQQGYRFEAVTVLDDFTVKVRMPPGYQGPGYQDDIVYYPKHLLEGLDPKKFEDWEFWTRPVGNGPFRFFRYQPGTMIEFEANPDYYRARPRIGRVVLKFVGEAGPSDLLAGNVDALSRVDPAWIPSLAADRRFHVYYSGTPDYYAAILWQQRNPLFRDSRVRRALTLAIDRRELLQLLHYPKESPLTDSPVTRREYQRGDLSDPLPYDPAKARELLEAVGWQDRSGGGVREREGFAFAFTALVPKVYQQMAIYVQAQLRRIGVEMTMLMQEGIRAKVKSGEFQEAAFDRAQGLSPFDYTQANSLGYGNGRVADLVSRLHTTADPDVEDRIYRELREIFREDMPVTYLVPHLHAAVAHQRIRGLDAPRQTDLLRIMEDLWLENQR